jgi:hypothetical protein
MKFYVEKFQIQSTKSQTIPNVPNSNDPNIKKEGFAE